MKVLITGGAGFLGQRLASALLQRGSLNASYGPEPIESITVLDVVAPAAADLRIRRVVGDISNRSVLERAMNAGPTAVFHLAAIVSGQGRVGPRPRHADQRRRYAVVARALPPQPVCGRGSSSRARSRSSAADCRRRCWTRRPSIRRPLTGSRKRSASCWSATIRGAGSSMAVRCGCRRSASARASPTPRRRRSRAASFANR